MSLHICLSGIPSLSCSHITLAISGEYLLGLPVRFTVWVFLAGAGAATLRGLAVFDCDADVSGMIPIPSWVAMALSVFAF